MTDRPQVIRVDVETRNIDYIKVGTLGGHGIKISKDGKFCYGSSIQTGDFWEIDTASLKHTRTYGFPSPVRPFVISSDSQFAFVQLSHLHGFCKFNLKSWTVEETVNLPENPADTPKETRWPFTVDHGIGISPDQKYLVCLATTANDVYVLDYPNMNVVKRIKVGIQPSYLTFDPSGNFLYVSSRVSNQIHVIELRSLEVAHVMNDVGSYTQRIAVSK